jgi:hypothetical protein
MEFELADYYLATDARAKRAFADFPWVDPALGVHPSAVVKPEPKT